LRLLYLLDLRLGRSLALPYHLYHYQKVLADTLLVSVKNFLFFLAASVILIIFVSAYKDLSTGDMTVRGKLRQVCSELTHHKTHTRGQVATKFCDSLVFRYFSLETGVGKKGIKFPLFKLKRLSLSTLEKDACPFERSGKVKSLFSVNCCLLIY